MSSADAVEIPLIKATNETLNGYGYLIDSYENSDIEIVTWPKQGWREIDEGTGNEGGSTEGSFDAWWEGSTLYGQNNAVQHNSDYEVDGKYILGYALPPGSEAKTNYSRLSSGESDKAAAPLRRPRRELLLHTVDVCASGGGVYRVCHDGALSNDICFRV